jgi:hypothetical protein
MLACLLTILFVSAARPAESGKADFVFAYTNRIFADVDPKDAIAESRNFTIHSMRSSRKSKKERSTLWFSPPWIT